MEEILLNFKNENKAKVVELEEENKNLIIKLEEVSKERDTEIETLQNGKYLFMYY